ncbi:MAG TPA: zf-TFIIB domain-containing protein [Phycicoccus sp.]
MTRATGRTAALPTVDLATRQGRPRTCPGCGVPGLHARPGAERAVLACPRCGGSWLVELGYLVPLGTGPAGTQAVARPGPGGVASA